jgi:T-complex protein 1 subunit alpha
LSPFLFVVRRYALAAREAARYVEAELRVAVGSLGPEALRELARTTLASKVLGGGDSAFFAAMCVEAVQVGSDCCYVVSCVFSLP